MLSNQPKCFLHLCRNRVLEPEQMIRFQTLAQSRRFYGTQPVMYIVKQVQGWAKLRPQSLEQFGNGVKVQLAAPYILRRQTLLGRFVIHLPAADSVSTGESRNAALRAHCLVTKLNVVRDRSYSLVDIVSVGVTIDEDCFARSSSEKLIYRSIERLASDVPQRCIHGANGRHRHWTSPPICAFVEILPGVLDPPGVSADQERNDVVSEITDDRQLSPV